MEDRIKVGMEFLHRDMFAEYEELSMKSLIRVDKFMEEFSNIPEVVDFFDKYIARCETNEPAEWCTKCQENGNTLEECPEYYDPEFDTCAIKVPVDEFLGIKGEAILRFDANIPTEILADNPIKVVKASITVKDDDGTPYTAEDFETYNFQIRGQQFRNAGMSFVNIQHLDITTDHRPAFSGEAYKVKTPLKLFIEKQGGGYRREYDVPFTPTNVGINEWTFQIPAGDYLPEGRFIITIKGIKENTLDEIVESTSSIQIITPAITIDHIGTINNTKPTFSGTSTGLTSAITIEVDGSTYYDIPVINNYWRFEMPRELNDGVYEIKASGSWKYTSHDFGTVEATQNFNIDSTAVIDLYPPSGGFINLFEYTRDLVVEGEVTDIPDGQLVYISLFGRDYTTEIQNGRFQITIQNKYVRELTDGTRYIITATTEDQLGNRAKDQEVILVDFQKPIPDIDLEPIPDIDPNSETVRITGLVSGDAKAGDFVTITVGSNTYEALVYKDTRYPTINYNLEIDYSDLYYIIILYFNGIYRTNPDYIQSFKAYQILTDINFDLNYYSLIVDIKEFFTQEFIYFLKTLPGSIPFANDYGTEIKLAVQTKNYIVQRMEIEAEINFFIRKFNALYGDMVQVKEINIVNQESEIGADSWLIEVYANIQQDRLIYRLEI
jgi:hypothetical protein